VIENSTRIKVFSRTGCKIGLNRFKMDLCMRHNSGKFIILLKTRLRLRKLENI
jgi:hypothetical protein